jgi:hypothetical protein
MLCAGIVINDSAVAKEYFFKNSKFACIPGLLVADIGVTKSQKKGTGRIRIKRSKPDSEALQRDL